jgi:predicted HTH transcriptional regulator
MTQDELLKRIQAGESDDFEVKKAAWEVPEDAYKTVSAFANTAGGWLVFGVSEQDGDLVSTGVDNPDDLETAFLGTCRSGKFSGTVEISPKRFQVAEARLLAFHIQPVQRFDKPLRVRVKKEWQAFIRLGTGDHQCNEVEEARFWRDASREAFDSQIYAYSFGLKDLDLEAVAWLRGFANRNPDRTYPEDPEAFLRELNLLRDEGFTNAAVLLFGKHAAVAIKPSGIVDFRQMHANSDDYVITNGWDDREMCDGNIADAARSLMGRFYRLTPQPFEMEPNGIQHKALSTDYLAVREALVNLLIHQDYNDNRKAKILWYDDRIVFDNPGDSYVTPSKMLEGGNTEDRNPLLVRVMRQAGFVEDVGRGVLKIVQVWEAAGRARPEIVNDPGKKTYQLVLPLPWRAVSQVSTAPFVVGQPIERDEDLFGFQAQRERLRESLESGQSVQILGDKLVGKTSLLKWLERHASEWQEHPVVSMNAQGLGGQSPADLVLAIAAGLDRREAVEQALTDGKGDSLAAARVLDGLLPLVLLVDEASVLPQHGFDVGFLGALRTFCQDLRLVWVSTSCRDIRQLFRDAGLASQFLNDGRVVWVDQLEEDAARDLVARLDENLAEMTLREAGGFAYGLQWLGDSLWRDPSDPEASCDAFSDEMRSVFDDWWRPLDAEDHELLKQCVPGLARSGLTHRLRRDAHRLKRQGLLAESAGQFVLPGTAWRDFVQAR